MSEYKPYKIPDSTLPHLDIAHHIDDINDLIIFLNHHGIKTNNTRISRYLNYFKTIEKNGLLDGANFFKNSLDSRFKTPIDWYLYTLREIHELMWISKGFKQKLPNGGVEKLKILVGGKDFSALDNNSLSRDIQFELRVASYFCQEGCAVDMSSDTDIIAVSKYFSFYLECKRIYSEKQLQKRLSDAEKQLKKRMPKSFRNRPAFGIIAADVTGIAFPHNGLTFAFTNEHSRDVVQEKLTDVTKMVHGFSIFGGCNNLINYWFQIHIPELILHPYQPGTRFSSSHIFKADPSRKQNKAIKYFKNLFEGASNKLDNRTVLPEKLSINSNLKISAGTSFGFEDGVLDEVISGNLKERNDEEKVAHLIINKINHDFYFFDLKHASQFINDEIDIESTERGDIAFSLIIEMYLLRFPYE